jgi:hypothetical protein
MQAEDLCLERGLEDDSYREVRSLLCEASWRDLQREMVTTSLLNGGTGALEDAAGAELAKTLLRYINRLELGESVAAEALLAALSSEDAAFVRQGIRYSAVKLAFDENELKLWCQRNLLPKEVVEEHIELLNVIDFAVRCGD